MNTNSTKYNAMLCYLVLAFCFARPSVRQLVAVGYVLFGIEKSIYGRTEPLAALHYIMV